jgi:hypothetical protein
MAESILSAIYKPLEKLFTAAETSWPHALIVLA